MLTCDHPAPSLTKALSLFTGAESQPAGLRIFLNSAYHLCSPKVTHQGTPFFARFGAVLYL